MRDEDIPALLKSMREARGYSMRELARRCGQSATWYVRKETGERRTSFSDLALIAEQTGHRIDLEVVDADAEDAHGEHLAHVDAELRQAFDGLDAEDRATALRLLRHLPKVPDFMRTGWVESAEYFAETADDQPLERHHRKR